MNLTPHPSIRRHFIFSHSPGIRTWIPATAGVMVILFGSAVRADETQIKVGTVTYLPYATDRAVGAKVYLNADINPANTVVRATQRSLGYRDVDAKAELIARLAWSPLTADKITTNAGVTTYDYSGQSNITNDLVGYWTRKIVPILIGPDGVAYLANSHHTVAAYLAANPATQREILPGQQHVMMGTIAANYYDPSAATHPAPDDAWWLARQSENIAYLYAPGGNQLARSGDPGFASLGPILPSAQAMPLVPGKFSMTNDPYRGMTAAISDGLVKSATTSAGVKIVGFSKTNSLSTATPQPEINYVEFYWGDFLRNRVAWDDTKTGSAFGSGQPNANLLKAPVSYYAAIANGTALAKSELYRDQYGRNLTDYNTASAGVNTQTWAGASLKNGLAKAGETYNMYMLDDSRVDGDIIPSALSTNKLHIDTAAGMVISGMLKNFSTVEINGGSTLEVSFKDAPLIPFNSVQTIPAGTGTVTLTAANTYTGLTTVAGGTLALTGSGSISLSSKITINSGAAFNVSGTSSPFMLGSGQTLVNNGSATGPMTGSGAIEGSGTFNGNVTLQNGARVSPGSSRGTLTFASGLTLEDGTMFTFDLGSTSDLVRISGGTFDGSGPGGTSVRFSFGPGFVPGSTYTLFDWTGAATTDVDATDFTFPNTDPGSSALFAIQGNSLVGTVVPEPGSCVLVTAGAFGLTISRRRRRVSQSN